MSEVFVDNDGTKLWTVSQGLGVPIVLCNGGPGCCDYLQPVADLVIDRAQVIRFEPRGCGRSDPTPPYDLNTSLLDLEAIRRHYEIEQWFVGGHSAGADLALAYALAHRFHTTGLICISGGRIHNDREWHKVYSARKAEEAPLEYLFPPNPEVNAQGNAAWKQFIQQPTLLSRIAQLDVPALFVYGSEDIRPSWPVEQVANLMPFAKFKMINGATHNIWLTHAEELQQLLRKFIPSLQT